MYLYMYIYTSTHVFLSLSLSMYIHIYTCRRVNISMCIVSIMIIMIKNLIGDHFCEDSYGRNGHGHVFQAIRKHCKLNFFQIKLPITFINGKVVITCHFVNDGNGNC